MMKPLIEICVDTLDGAKNAARGGASRIELCSSLSEGGVTPSLGLVELALSSVRIPIHVMVRPRAGDFVYSREEFSSMERDIEHFKRAGVHGVVLGLLTRGREVDTDRTRQLVQRARPMSVTFHRAFDDSADLERSLEKVIASGAHMLLTSGGEVSLGLGAKQVARLVQLAGDRIEIMGGAGVTIETAAALWQATHTAAIHASLRRAVIASSMQPRSNAATGVPSTHADAEFALFEEDVRALVESFPDGSPSLARP
jgi:copper homeostasis protein